MASKIDFDPKRPANWFGGIARAIREQGVDWASVDNLAERTLRVMNILTRSKPRERLLAEIRKAIKTLCRQGVLSEYRAGKVRIADAERLNRYLTSNPRPRSSDSGAASPPERRAAAGRNASSQESPEAPEGWQPSLGLPPLSSSPDDEEEEPSTPDDAAPDDDEDPERKAIRLLIGGSSAQKASVDRPMPPALGGPPATIDPVPVQGEFLDELATALHHASSSWRTSVAANVLTGSWRGDVSNAAELVRCGAITPQTIQALESLLADKLRIEVRSGLPCAMTCRRSPSPSCANRWRCS